MIDTTTSTTTTIILPRPLIEAGLAHSRWESVQVRLELLHEDVLAGRAPPEAAVVERQRLDKLLVTAKALSDINHQIFIRWCVEQDARPEMESDLWEPDPEYRLPRR